MQLNDTPLLTAEQIQRRVSELAEQISKDFAEREVILVGVLKGSLIFLADLIRWMTVPVSIEFIRARSYQKTKSSGRIEFTQLPEQPVAGKHVLIVEDIIDTGTTAAAILARIKSEGPASVALCALLDKPSHRTEPVTIDYTGFTVEDHFVVGYGLDYEERGRELPDVHVLEKD